ncbi:Allergen Fus c 3 [Fusarium oxysporum f. sp. rapae]|uniref:Allergen Fus c 3 n=1 Tax=Fusarium oxysporum f. sp. rapae TaxID=485398 RepID=A0A8J5TN51_FUSOX|nr:Allergen Fus c 3 [Fusarium oxysporum f. sp. rapae]
MVVSTDTITADPHELPWGRRESRPEQPIDYLDKFSQDNIFADLSCGIALYDLPIVSPVPNIASFQPSPTISPADHFASEPSFPFNIPAGDNDEFVALYSHPIGSQSSELDTAATWPELDQKRILARPSEASSPESNDFNDYPAGNHISSQRATKAPIEVKLRSASRRPKRFRRKPPLPPNIQQARECHNNVDKQYRTRLKLRFESLLMAIQGSRPKNDNVGGDDSMDADHCYSRGEVLDAARQRILAMEEENKRLSTRIQVLSKSPMIN